MEVQTLAHLGFHLIKAIGARKHDHITLAEIRQRIRYGTIIEFLDEEMGLELQIDPITLSPIDRLELACEWADIERHAPADFGPLDGPGLWFLANCILEGVERLHYTVRAGRV